MPLVFMKDRICRVTEQQAGKQNRLDFLEGAIMRVPPTPHFGYRDTLCFGRFSHNFYVL